MAQVPRSRKIFFNWYIIHVGTIQNMDCSWKVRKKLKIADKYNTLYLSNYLNSFVLVDLVTNKTL